MINNRFKLEDDFEEKLIEVNDGSKLNYILNMLTNELFPKFTLNALKQTIKDTNNYRFLLNQFINSEKSFEQVEVEDLSKEGKEFFMQLYFNMVSKDFNIISKKEASND